MSQAASFSIFLWYGMEERSLKKKLFYKVLTALTAGGLFLLFLLWKGNGDGGKADSFELVPVEEVRQELGFGIYSEWDWQSILGDEQVYLTWGKLQTIEQLSGIEPFAEEGGISTENLHEYVPRAEWMKRYRMILDLLDDGKEITEETVLLLEQLPAEEGQILVTNEGEFLFRTKRNILTNWNSYEIWKKDGECIGIAALYEGETQLDNVYIQPGTTGKITFLFGGSSYEISYSGNGEKASATTADLIFEKGVLTRIHQKQDLISGNLLSYNADVIEIEGYGRLSHTERLPVYEVQADGTAVERSLSDVVLGNMEVCYVAGEGYICAILITAPAQLQTIRVLLLAEDGNRCRSDIWIKSDADGEIRTGDTVTTYHAGELLQASKFQQADPTDTLFYQMTDQSGLFYLCDSDGNICSNGYSGSLELRHTASGYTLVNVVPLETYLCSVVSSEMPSSFEKEALKAQAVCARSYAYIQILRGDLAAYGAHVDDSTAYQVYNKTVPQDNVKEAVAETASEILTCQGEPVEAYYFSTSVGFTNTPDAWNVTDPGQYPYLQRVCLNIEPSDSDLSKEQTFRDYLTQVPPGYDSEIRYYRWTAEVDFRPVLSRISDILKNRHSISPENVIYYESDGKETEPFDIRELTGFGEMTRNRSGYLTSVTLTCDSGMVEILTEYNIRLLFGTAVTQIAYADGSKADTLSMLPSAACVIDRQTDGTYRITGGGFGHGIGMSQNGANGMSKRGFGYQDILTFFYQNTELTRIR